MERRACRDGKHAFDVPRDIGAGLTRRRCKYCRAIELDLRDREDRRPDDEPRQTGLFGARERVTIFDIEQAVSAGLYEVDTDD